MRIGIFLGYGPQVHLGTEGLGRYIGGLIKGFAQENTDTTIAVPKWLRPSLDNLFNELDVPKASIKYISNKRESLVWIIYKKLVLEKTDKKNLFVSLIQRVLMTLLLLGVRASIKIPVVLFVLACILVVIGAIALLPVIVILGLISLVAQKIMGKLKLKTGHLVRGFIVPENDTLFLDVYYEMTNSVIELLIKKINEDQQTDIWYVPSLFWPQVNKIKRPLVINAPDLVTAEYPVAFAAATGMSQQAEQVKATVYGGKYFITYCEFIRRTLLIRDFGKDPDNVVAIRHINNTSKPQIAIDPARGQRINSRVEPELELCHKLINELVSKSAPAYYTQQMHLENVHYLFYASQIRPHKNVLNLIKAVEYLIHEKNVPIKLFLTGFFCKDIPSEISEYVFQKRLEHDVISFNNVPTQTLAALYRCADMVVNPSMYEGGFAFTFGEGMSVGTPSVLANIPFEMDVLGPAGLEDVTFDPTDWHDIADKIEYWLPRREELYQKELPLYEELAKRTPDVVAKEYIKTFEYFIDKSRADKEMEARKTEAGKTIG